MLNNLKKNQDIVKNSYNISAEEWDDSRKNMHWGEFDYFYKKVPFGNNEKILDLGCGNGRLFNFFESKGINHTNYTGMDFSEKLLDKAKNNYPENKYFFGDISKKEFHFNEKFNQIWCIAMFHHLGNKKERINAIKNLSGLLEKDGKVFLTVWNLYQENKNFKKILKKSFWRNIFSFGFYSKQDCFFYWKNTKILRYYYAFKKNEVKKLFEENGFKIISFEEGNNFSLILEKK